MHETGQTLSKIKLFRCIQGFAIPGVPAVVGSLPKKAIILSWSKDSSGGPDNLLSGSPPATGSAFSRHPVLVKGSLIISLGRLF
jgi:hypothetical protein